MLQLQAWQWLVGSLCAFMIGVAKTGLPGFGVLSIPLMILTVGDARLSAGWLLPILCTADVFAVVYWRRHADVARLFSLIPWVLIGMVAGAAALGLSERMLRSIIAVIVLIMVGVQVWRRRRPEAGVSGHAPPYGIAAGFATTVANAAGPVMYLYLLTKRLPKERFVATGAWFFFVVNLAKVPIYAWHGLFSARSLAFDACMVPVVLVGALTGRWIIRVVPQAVFETLVTALAAISSLLLFR